MDNRELLTPEDSASDKDQVDTTEAEIKSFIKSSPKLIRELMESGEKRKEELGKELMQICRDKGTSRDTHTIFEIKNPITGDIEKIEENEKRHYILNRTAMISRLEEEIEDGKEIKVNILDVKRFDEANKIETKEESTHKPADVVIEINNRIEEAKGDKISQII